MTNVSWNVNRYKHQRWPKRHFCYFLCTRKIISGICAQIEKEFPWVFSHGSVKCLSSLCWSSVKVPGKWEGWNEWVNKEVLIRVWMELSVKKIILISSCNVSLEFSSHLFGFRPQPAQPQSDISDNLWIIRVWFSYNSHLNFRLGRLMKNFCGYFAKRLYGSL